MPSWDYNTIRREVERVMSEPDDAVSRLDEVTRLAGLRAELRLPFAPAQVGHLPRAGITLEYVGHGAVTSRLLDIDPEWGWEPVSFGEDGQPVLQTDGDGNPVGLWIRLTVLGVTRFGFGNCKSGQFDAEKVLIGDAIRNAAMRFGVALDLWVKGHAEDDENVAANDDRTRPARGKQAPRLCVRCKEVLVGDAKAVDGGFAHADCVEPRGSSDTQPELSEAKT